MSNDDVIGPDDLDPEMMIVEEIDGDEIDPDAKQRVRLRALMT
jgi:hypothetical protein